MFFVHNSHTLLTHWPRPFCRKVHVLVQSGLMLNMVDLRCGQIHQQWRYSQQQSTLLSLRQRYDKNVLGMISTALLNTRTFINLFSLCLRQGKYTSSSNEGSCTTWSSCAAGKYVSDAGSSTNDRGCTNCGSGTRVDITLLFFSVLLLPRSRKCYLIFFTGEYTSSFNQGSCSTWSTCAAGKYVSDGGTTSSNRKCASCSNGEASDTPGACDCSTHHTCLLRPFHTHPQASLPPHPIGIRARPGPLVLRAPESCKSPAARRIARASVARTVRCQGPLHTTERWVSGNLLLLRQD